jgi:hypothetical protein
VMLLFAIKQPAAALGQQPDMYAPVLRSIATGLVVSGFISVLFTIIRELDHRDAERSNARVGKLIELEQDLREGLSQLRRTLLVAKDPDERRIFDAHPVQQVREEIAGATRPIIIDALGLSLKALYQLHIRELLPGTECTIRLLLQDPCDDAVAIMCTQAARDREARTRDILQVTKLVKEVADTDDGRGLSHIEVRWLQAVASLSLTRVNDWRVVRPRFFDEGMGNDGFFGGTQKKEVRC